MAKRLAAACSILALMLCLVPAASADLSLDIDSYGPGKHYAFDQLWYGDYNPAFMVSGDYKKEKLSKAELTQLLEENPIHFDGRWYDYAPSATAPFDTGEVSKAVLNTALNRTNALRRIAGVDEVTLDHMYNRSAQYGAVLLEAEGTLSHYFSSAPAGMDAYFFKEASEALENSNLHMDIFPKTDHNIHAVDAFASDGGTNNLSDVGHRRWLFNPRAGKVGFGCSGHFFTHYCTDQSERKSAGFYLSWPASGNFPADIEAFTSSTAWSVDPGSYFATPKAEDLTVTLTEMLTGRSFTFSGKKNYEVSPDGEYFGVSSTAYGGSGGCIIFRPAGVKQYIGPWSVTVSGLKEDFRGEDTDIHFVVDFFRTSPKPSFADIPESHWAFPAVQYASDIGVVNGIGNGTFDGNGEVSASMFAAMVTRIFCRSQLSEVAPGSPWYAPNIEAAERCGLLDGTQAGSGDVSVEDPMSRYDMAAVTANVLSVLHKLPDDISEAPENIPDWGRIPEKYRTAVAVCNAAGIITGIDSSGTFQGDATMTRSQAAMIVYRLLDYALFQWYRDRT